MSAPKTVLILGGTSDIGFATAKYYAAKGWRVILAGRNAEQLARNLRDLETRHGSVARSAPFDALNPENAEAFVDGLDTLPDTVVCVVGLLGDQARAERDIPHALTVLRSNFEGPAVYLSVIANRMAARGNGTIIGVGSVAGDRGRASNYVYGSAKAGFAAFLSGLRNRLASKGVRVVTIKPGFVNTRMTANMRLPKPLTAEPDEVAQAIYTAGESGRADVLYVRGIWRLIMAIITALPESVFKKTKL